MEFPKNFFNLLIIFLSNFFHSNIVPCHSWFPDSFLANVSDRWTRMFRLALTLNRFNWLNINKLSRRDLDLNSGSKLFLPMRLFLYYSETRLENKYLYYGFDVANKLNFDGNMSRTYLNIFVVQAHFNSNSSECKLAKYCI